MESELDEQNPTAGDSGASTLDRIESYLSGTQPQSQPVDNEPAKAQTSPAEPEAVESDVTDDGAIEADQQPQLTTSDLAKMLGVDEDVLDLSEDGTVKLKTKVDGKDDAPKLADLLKTYQIQGHAENRVREVAKQEEALRVREQEVQQQFTQRLQYAESLVNVAAQDLMREFQSVNWPALEQQDPGTAALMRQKFQERQQSLRGVLQQVEQNKSQLTQREAQNRQQMVAKEAEKLVSLVPEWKDSSVAEKERAEIRKWATESGFEAGELENFVLAHHVSVMRKAMKYDQQQKMRPAIEAQVRTAPKLVKPGQPAQNTQGQKLQGLKQSIVKSGGKRGIAEYLLAAGKV
jgi:hypothetical protein